MLIINSVMYINIDGTHQAASDSLRLSTQEPLLTEYLYLLILLARKSTLLNTIMLQLVPPPSEQKSNALGKS